MSGVNDGVIEIISDTTVYRLHPNIILDNYEYDVWPSENLNQENINQNADENQNYTNLDDDNNNKVIQDQKY